MISIQLRETSTSSDSCYAQMPQRQQGVLVALILSDSLPESFEHPTAKFLSYTYQVVSRAGKLVASLSLSCRDRPLLMQRQEPIGNTITDLRISIGDP